MRAEIRIRFVVDNLEYLVQGAASVRPAVWWAISCRVKPILGIIDRKIEP